MSAPMRNQRTRLKPQASDPSVRSKNSKAQAEQPPKNERERERTPPIDQQEAQDILLQLSNGTSAQTRPHTSNSTEDGNMTAMPSEDSEHPHPSAAPSDSGSSSLSELDGTLDDDDQLSELDSDDVGSERGSEEEEEEDTEAETERLDNSPEKRRRDAALSEAAATRNLHGADSGDESDVDNEDDQESLSGGDLPSVEPLGADTTIAMGLPEEEMAGRKRKRTMSLGRNSTAPDIEPARKRSASARQISRTLSVRGDLGDIHQELDEGDDPDDADEEALSDQSDEDHERLAKADAHGSASPGSHGHKTKGSDLEDDGDSSGRELSEPPEDQEQLQDPDQEDGEQVAAEGDEDDEGADAAAKSEDELARKMAAMEALKPIESLFAIFRDKLFDERLAMLSDELELLRSPNPDHPTFIAMRRALDVRRDEKIALEQVSLQYRLGVLERVTVASQAQLHSQFYQSVRQHRETHMSTLNEHFSRIQRDRRQMKSNEPQYGMRFSTRRSEQIANQRSYNKEVSLLSGIARHVGFPAAPDISAPSQLEIDDDLRAMKIRAPEPQYISQPLPGGTRIHQDEGVTDEAWFEKNAWANPNHPANQQARFLDRQAMANVSSYATPAAQGRTLDARHAIPGSGSTLELASEHPSSALGPSRGLNGHADSEIYDKSSPFEQMKRRNIETHRPDGTPRAHYTPLNHGFKQQPVENEGLGIHRGHQPAPQREADMGSHHQYAQRPEAMDISPENDQQRSLGYAAGAPVAPLASSSTGLGVR